MSVAEAEARVHECLTQIYGEPLATETLASIRSCVRRYAGKIPVARRTGWSERDAFLIVYPDQVRRPPEPPLRVLASFTRRHLTNLISGIHLLPFFPSSSDDGFSVIDYRQVDPAYGTWEDVHDLGPEFRLMFDAVVNHVSAESQWFQGFLRGESPYDGHFVVINRQTDLSAVFRPRDLPLLTPFQTAAGERQVWTTFSADQVDLNYRNPRVLVEILDVLLFYASQGASLLRLDAVAFLWKQPGTSCVHLSQTHSLVRLFRAVLDWAAPHVLLVSETNVPHAENVSYFGGGHGEAQLVYNFALPPLVLDAFASANGEALTSWAASIRPPSPATTFFNFLASHDGIGLGPARGLISQSRIEALVERTLANGGHVSDRRNPDGSSSPYELNINYLDALNDPSQPQPMEVEVARFEASQAIMLSMAGVPGIYLHSLFGSHGWPEGVRLTGRARTINRQKLELAELESELAQPGSLREAVFGRLAALLRARRLTPAFHPNANQEVLHLDESLFAVLRLPMDGSPPVLCLHNLTRRPVRCSPASSMGDQASGQRWSDLIRPALPVDLRGGLELAPYQVAWLRPVG